MAALISEQSIWGDLCALSCASEEATCSVPNREPIVRVGMMGSCVCEGGNEFMHYTSFVEPLSLLDAATWWLSMWREDLTCKDSLIRLPQRVPVVCSWQHAEIGCCGVCTLSAPEACSIGEVLSDLLPSPLRCCLPRVTKVRAFVSSIAGSPLEVDFQHVLVKQTVILLCFETTQCIPKLCGGGLSVGQLLQRVRSLRPELTVAQSKALCAASPKLVKTIEKAEGNAAILKQIHHEEKRLGVTPQLGAGALAEDKAGDQAPQHDSESWQSEARKKGGQTVHREPRAMQLKSGQVVSDGLALPVRTTLIAGLPGVVMVANQEQLQQHIARHAGASVPLAIVAPKQYTLPKDSERLLHHQPTECSLLFEVSVAGTVEEAQVGCVLYTLSKVAVRAIGVQELTVVVGAAVTFKLEIIPDAVRGQGFWVPQKANVAEARQLLREVLDGDLSPIRDLWQPKTLAGGTVLLKTTLQQAGPLQAKCCHVGLALTPPVDFLEQTRVVWMRGVRKLDEARDMAALALQDAPLTSQLPKSRLQWRKDAALVIKRDTSHTSFGIRVPLQQANTIAGVLGQDVRKMWHMYGVPPQWVAEDVAEVCERLAWQAEPIRRTRGKWLLRASEKPRRITFVVHSDYERLTLRLEQAERERSEWAEARKQVDPGRQKGDADMTWSRLVRAEPRSFELNDEDTGQGPATDWENPVLDWSDQRWHGKWADADTDDDHEFEVALGMDWDLVQEQSMEVEGGDDKKRKPQEVWGNTLVIDPVLENEEHEDS
eukprot:6462508-Amphidinium_carterae.1